MKTLLDDSPMHGSLVIVSESKYYSEYRDACAANLSDLGWKIHVQNDFQGISAFDGVIVVGTAFHRWVPFRPGQFRVGIQGEQLPLPGDSDWSLLRNKKRFDAISRYYDLVVEWQPSNYIHTSCRSPRIYLPHGAPEPSGLSRSDKWDAVFLGNPYGGDRRRIPMLEALAKACQLCPVREAWQDEKYQILNSSKICLNIHQFSSACFEAPRFFELLVEGVFLLSEKVDNSFPFVEGRDYVSFVDQDDMLAKVHHYLAKPQERIAIAESGRRTALNYPQGRVFQSLSIELQQLQRQVQPMGARLVRWLNGIWKTSIIEAFDFGANVKRKFYQ